MALTLYRRHRLECEAGRVEDAKSGEWEERRKGWKRCNCGIHFSGTLGGKFSRKASGTSDWAEAQRIADAYVTADSWSGTPKPPVALPAETAAQASVTIADACQVFITSRESAQIAPATLRKYRTFTKQLGEYADRHGYFMLDQFTPSDVDLFYAALKFRAAGEGQAPGHLAGVLPICRAPEVDRRDACEPGYPAAGGIEQVGGQDAVQRRRNRADPRRV